MILRLSHVLIVTRINIFVCVNLRHLKGAQTFGDVFVFQRKGMWTGQSEGRLSDCLNYTGQGCTAAEVHYPSRKGKKDPKVSQPSSGLPLPPQAVFTGSFDSAASFPVVSKDGNVATLSCKWGPHREQCK